MNKLLMFIAGFAVGAGAGVTGTYFFTRNELKKSDDEIKYLNKELNDLTEQLIKNDNKIDTNKPVENVKEETIPELKEMADEIIKNEQYEKTDYTQFSTKQEDQKEDKKEEKREEKPEMKIPIEYVNDDGASRYVVHNGYVKDDMTLFNDGVLTYDDEYDTIVNPEELGIDLSNMYGEVLHAVDHNEKRIYAIVKIDQSYKSYMDLEEDEEEENEEDEQS